MNLFLGLLVGCTSSSPDLGDTAATGDTLDPTGTPATATTGDTGPSPGPPALDVLLVIDTSRSMTEIRPVVAESVAPLLSPLGDRDWHVAAVLTGPSATSIELVEGTGGVRVIDGEVAEPEQVLSSLVGVDALINENYAFEAVLFVLERERSSTLEPLGFRRPEADLHIVFVSDQDDSTWPAIITLAEFERYLDDIDTPVHVHALVPSAEAELDPGIRYSALNDHFGGVLGDISMDETYGDFFAAVAATFEWSP